MKNDNKVSEYIEWKAVSYRVIRPWIVLAVVALLLVAVYLVSRFGFSGKSTPKTVEGKLEKRSARFFHLYGDVRVKPAGSANWISADLKMQIYPGDMVSTSVGSSCRITFFDGTIYDVKPNSMINVQESHEDSATLRKSVRIELAKGGVDLSTPETTMSKSKIETASTVADMGPNTVAQALIDEKDARTQVKIFQGKARVATHDGKQSVDLGLDELAIVGKTGIEKAKLPSAPRLLEPQNSEILTTSNPDRFTVLLRWDAGSASTRFRVTVSQDSYFSTTAFSEEVSNQQFSLVKGLPFGTFYWRVIPLDDQGREGSFRAVSIFKIRPKSKDSETFIRFDITSVEVYGNVLLLKGKADPFYQVLINGKIVAVGNDGSFNHYTEPIAELGDAVDLRIQLRNEAGTVKEFIRKISLR